ncbi:hypothetical protein [Curtobacterium sp. ISL-83]|uniref:hypothetical protein n=1 Tax=Curtobacterium sp. ISL-83 TaxID=2819145 RepID=UPI001BE70835|nr:hypothetical protein [Curtobacterium sp. ISL-83]MBT2501222.1 hypothetical protein [Curtobacterium sp. ISL-83]
MHTLTTRLLAGAAGVVTVGAIAIGSVAAANAATPAPAPSAPSQSTSAATGLLFRAIAPRAIRAEFGSVPSALTSDAKALAGKKGTDRKTAVRSIETKALDGGYGSQVESAATAAKAALATEPAALRKALRALHGTTGTARAQALAAIDTAALHGTYGTGIQRWARTVQADVARQQADRLPAIVGSVI